MATPEEEARKQAARQEIDKNMAAAVRVSQMKQNLLKGKTFKARYLDNQMEPTLQPGDTIEVGGCAVMEFRAGDLVYFQQQEAFEVRKIVRHSREGSEIAFLVKAEASMGETTLPANQILGRVMTIERRGQTIVLHRPKPANLGERILPMADDALNWIRAMVEKVTELIGRGRGKS